MAKKDRSSRSSYKAPSYRTESKRSRSLSSPFQGRRAGPLDAIGGSFDAFSPDLYGDNRYSRRSEAYQTPKSIRENRDRSLARANSPSGFAQRFKRGLLPAKATAIDLKAMALPLAKGRTAFRQIGAHIKRLTTPRQEARRSAIQAERAPKQLPHNPMGLAQKISTVRTEHAKRSLVREPEKRTNTNTCKARPNSNKGSGGSRAFVPWCDRKK